jgi:hypothetical protein
LRLCLHCARVGVHEPGCPADNNPRDPSADAKTRQARGVAGIEDVKTVVMDAETALLTKPREALRLLWVAEHTLELYPAADFESFDSRRWRNDILNSIQELRKRAETGLAAADARQLVEDLVFARRAFELFADVARVRHDAVSFDLSEFVQIPKSDRRDVGDDLKELCAEVEKQLATSVVLEKEVAAWGPENVVALARDLEPVAIPEKLLGESGRRRGAVIGVALAVLGLALSGATLSPFLATLLPFEAKLGGLALSALIAVAGGLVAHRSAKRARALDERRQTLPGELRARFKELSVQYRQRVYMSAALRVLRKKATFVEKAEDAFRKFTGGDQAARWKRVCLEAPDVVRTFFDWDQKQPLKDAISHAVAEAIGPKGRLRPFDEMAADGWEVLLEAFLLDVFAGDDAHFFDGLAPLVAEGSMEDHQLEKLALDAVAAWKSLVGEG